MLDWTGSWALLPDDIQEWAKNLMDRWAANDTTRARIIAAAQTLAASRLAEEAAAKAEAFITTASGTIKPSRVFEMADSLRTRVARQLRDLGIPPEIRIPGEDQTN